MALAIRFLLCLSLLIAPPAGAQAPAADESDLISRSVDLYRQGNCKEAMPIFEKILEGSPKNTAIGKLLGQCLLKERRMDEARAQFEKVLEISPKDVAALEGLRAAVTELQKTEQVRQSLAIESRALTQEELKAKTQFDRAGELIAAGRFPEAEAILDSIIQRYPESPTARQRRAEIYSTTNRFEAAAAEYRWLSQRPGAQPAYLKRMAQNLEWDGKLGEAESAYREYLGKKPDDLTARMSLGEILTWAGRFREAIPEFEAVLAGMPNNLRAQLALAMCYEQTDNFDKALEAYEKALAIDPESPQAQQARDRAAKFLDEMPRQQAYAAIERGDLDAAARLFIRYLEKHPDSQETVLQIARVYVWAEKFAEARPYFETYLERQPGENGVRRELARIEMWTQNYPAARRHYQTLVVGLDAARSDYESLIRAHMWDGDLAGAQPHAERLAKLDPDNAVARAALTEYAEQKRFQARNRADELAAAGRFVDAAQAYREYMASYGSDRDTELLVCRLYSWAKEYQAAAGCYRTYLGSGEPDTTARLELATIENWAGNYFSAESEYRTVLVEEPRNPTALLGLAQVLDYRGDDPIKVHNAFEQVLEAQPENTLAQQRVRTLRPQVSPTLDFLNDTFTDSDGLYWSRNAIEATFTLPGRVKVTPFYSAVYFRQRRCVQSAGEFSPPNPIVNGCVSSANPSINSLNARMRALAGSMWGTGGGVRVTITPNARWFWMGEIGALHYDSGNDTLNVKTELYYRIGNEHMVGVHYIRRDAIHDLWTVPTLAAGIVGDTVLLSYQVPLSPRWLFWAQAGFTHYSGGIDNAFPTNTQGRAAARLLFRPHSSIKMGYAMRLTGFDRASPLHFSPSTYQTHGFVFNLDHPVTESFRFIMEDEIAYSRIDGLANMEFSFAPSFNWDINQYFSLRFGYRFARGQNSGFNVDDYQTQGGMIRLLIVF